jgi:hypothetical protein
MNKTKKVVLSGLTAAILTAGILGTTYAYAQGAPGDSSNLVQEIANKFGLKQSDVQAVFDQDRADQKAQRQQQYEARLTQLVTDGKITADQKSLILAKHKELEENRQSTMEKMKTMSQSERKAAMDADKTALEAWAKQNNIDVKYVMGFGKGGGRGGHGPQGSAPQPTGTTQ